MIKLQLLPISIECLSADDHQNIAAAAWRISRPNVGEFEIKDVYGIDAPINDMHGMVLRMRVPILFREIISTMRDHVMWARTSRVDDLTTVWPILQSVPGAELAAISDLGRKLHNELTSDVPQDQYRLNIPLSYMTEMTVRLSCRSAIKLGQYISWLGFVHPHMHESCRSFADQLDSIMQLNGFPTHAMASSYKLNKICPDWTPGYDKGGRLGTTIVARAHIPIALRAQVVRHRTLNVSDQLSMFFHEENVWSTPISRNMWVELSGSVQTWRDIVSERNCWMAQTDLWKPILDEVNDHMVTHGLPLPCNQGVCPYAGDAKERVEGRDPGCPCPRYLNIAPPQERAHALRLATMSAYQQEMLQYVMDSGRPSYWQEEITHLGMHP